MLNFISTFVNENVGDALSAMLLTELALNYLNLSMQEWYSMYTDVPSRLLRLEISPHTITDSAQMQIAADRVTQTQDVQGNVNLRRALVRKSGTEPCLRVYTEASSQQESDYIAEQIGVALGAIKIAEQ